MGADSGIPFKSTKITFILETSASPVAGGNVGVDGYITIPNNQYTKATIGTITSGVFRIIIDNSLVYTDTVGDNVIDLSIYKEKTISFGILNENTTPWNPISVEITLE